MANDGSLIFDTKIDSKGFNKGVAALKKTAAAGVKAIGATMAAVGAGIVAITTASVKAYADYEQLVGGVDTLFGESSKKLQEYADQAYQTAGMSANQYMEQVTSFSASLLQSLGGDTEAAADKANQAMIDMSDNMNKMGSNMEDIQNAYQGFAKQNYTMLDNLKLGYGGTKDEMERLLADAQAISGVKYDVSSYADIVDAIHVIQTEMGITGTTAKEAATTITGSINSTKAAFQNLLVEVSKTGGDVEGAIKKLSDSAGNVVTNLTPVISGVVSALPTALAGIFEVLKQLFPQIAETLLSGIQELFPTILDLLFQIVDWVVENLDVIIKTGLDIVVALAQGIAEAIPELMPTILDCIDSIIDWIVENIDLLIDAGIDITLALAMGIVEAIPRIVERIPEIIMAIINALVEKWPDIKSSGLDLIEAMWEGIKECWDTVIEWYGGIWEDIKQSISDSWESIKQIGRDLITALWDGIKEAWESVKAWFSNAWNYLTSDHSIDVTANIVTQGSHANGLDYVPFDGYTATLHRGEMVVPAYDAQKLRASKGSSNYYNGGYQPMGEAGFGGKITNVTQNIYAEKQSPAQIFQQAKWMQERAVMMGV